MCKCAIFILVNVLSVLLASEKISVSSSEQLEKAISTAKPGTEIIFKNGHYNDLKVALTNGGTSAQKCVLRAETPGKVLLLGNSQILFNSNHWIVKDLFMYAEEKNKQNLVRFNAQFCRLTNCFLLRNGQGKFLYHKRSDLDNEDTVIPRYNRVDHSIIINFGKGDVSNWQRSAVAPIWHGPGNIVAHPRNSHMNGTRRMSVEKITSKKWWDNVTTSPFLRIDHCYINMPIATMFIHEQAQFRLDAKFAAKMFKISPDKLPGEYRDFKTRQVLSGLLLDANLIDMYGYQASTYFKGEGLTWFNNTFYKGQLRNWNGAEDSSLLNYFIDSGDASPYANSAGVGFGRQSFIAGNYIERRYRQRGHHAYGGYHDVLTTLGAGRPPIEGMEYGSVCRDQIIANNVVKLFGEGENQGQSFLNANARYFFWRNKPLVDGQKYGKFEQPLIDLYGSAGKVPIKSKTAYNNKIINNMVIAGDGGKHKLFTWQDGIGSRSEFKSVPVNDPWPQVLKDNVFSKNFASASILKNTQIYNEKGSQTGFTPLPAQLSSAGYIPPFPGDMARLKLPNHYMLPINMESLIYDRKVKLQGFQYSNAGKGIKNIDFSNLGDKVSLNRPLDFEDVGTSWLDKTTLRKIGLSLRQNKNGFLKGQERRKKIIDFPLPEDVLKSLLQK